MARPTIIARFSPWKVAAFVLPVWLMLGVLVVGSIARYGGLVEAVLGSGRNGAKLVGVLVLAPVGLLWSARLMFAALFRDRPAVFVRDGRLVVVGGWRAPLSEIGSVQDVASKASPWEGGRDVVIELKSGRRRTISTALLAGDPERLAGEMSEAIAAAL